MSSKNSSATSEGKALPSSTDSVKKKHILMHV